MMTSWPGNARCITTRRWIPFTMMTSSNGNIFRVTCPLWGKATGHGGFPSQRPVTRSFDNFIDLRLYKQLNKHSRHWWFETPLCSLWGRCNAEDQKCVPLMFCLLFAWTRCRKNRPVAGDLRCRDAHVTSLIVSQFMEAICMVGAFQRASNLKCSLLRASGYSSPKTTLSLNGCILIFD